MRTSTAIRWEALYGTGVVLFFIVLYWPYLAGTCFPLILDGYSELLPIARFTGGCLAQGRLPLWDPYSYCGHPVMALGYSACLYPLNALYGVARPELAVAVDTMLHALMQAFFYYLLGRSLFSTRGAALFTAAVGLVNYSMLESLEKGLIIYPRGQAYVPLMLLCVSRLLSAGTRGPSAGTRGPSAGTRGPTTGRGAWMLGLSLVLAIQWTCSQAEFMSYVLVALAFYTACELVRRRVALKEDWTTLGSKAALTLFGVGLGLALVAVQLLPIHELLTQSLRSHSVHGVLFLASYSLEFLSNTLIGQESGPSPAGKLGLVYLFVPPFALSLALFAVLNRQDAGAGRGDAGADSTNSRPSAGTQGQWPFLAALVFTTLYSLGSATPLFKLVSLLPVLNQCRVPFRMLYVAEVFCIVLSGWGMDALLKAASNHGLRLRSLLLFCFAAAVCLLPGVLAGSYSGTGEPLLTGAALLCLAVLVGFRFWVLDFGLDPGRAIASLFARVRTRGGGPMQSNIQNPKSKIQNEPNRAPFVNRWAVSAFVALGCLQLFVFGRSNMPPGDPSAYRTGDSYESFSRTKPDIDRAAIFYHFGTRTWSDQGMGMTSGFRVLSGYNALPLERLTEFVRPALEIAGGHKPLVFTWNDPSEITKLYLTRPDWIRRDTLFVLNLLNVRYLVFAAGDLSQDQRKLLGTASPKPIGRLTVYENPGAFPVAFTVHQARVVESASETLNELYAPGFNHRGMVLLDSAFDVGQLRPAEGPEDVVVSDYGMKHVELEVPMTAPGLVVLTDMYYPGWRATVDGQESKVLCADRILRAVFVPEGRHNVRFEYRPESLRRGAAVSAVAATVWLGIAAGLLVRRRRRLWGLKGRVGADFGF